MTDLHTAAKQDIPDLVSGALGVSRGTAYDLMREALAEQPERPYRQLQDNGSKYFGESWDKAEQPAQGCNHCNHALYAGTRCKNCGRVTEQAAIKRDLTPEQPAQPQEPVACVQDLDEVKRKQLVYEKGMDWKDPLYTSPQPAQRKPLTNEQIGQVARDAHIAFCLDKHQTYEHALTRAIEAAHGIKEST